MLVRAMATKKKASKKRSPAKKKPATPAAAKRGAAKAPKKAIAAKKKAAAPKAAKKAIAAKKKAAPPKAAKKAIAPKKAAKKKAVAPKAAASKAAPPKAAPKAAKKAAPAKPSPIHRRDGAGHLDAGYAAMLRAKSLEGRVRDPEEAFIGRSGRSKDNLAEQLGEAWVETATSGEDENEEVFNQDVPEDEGGPFVGSTAGQEFADGVDASNPKGAKREPFPKT
jgi:hypothetical protein